MHPNPYKDLIDYIAKPTGKPINLARCLKGVYMDIMSVVIYGESETEIQNILNHPKFVCCYNIAKRNGTQRDKIEEKELLKMINAKYGKMRTSPISF